jgi:adenylate cyclase
MEQLAEPGKIYVSRETATLVSGYFDLDDLGEFKIKGSTEPVEVLALSGVGAMRTRLDVSRAREFSLFVGRDDEVQTLESALERAQAGHAQVVGVVADAGTGKSRLCAEFVDRCRSSGLTVFEAHGVSYGKAIPFLPMLELFRAYYGISEDDPPETAREKIAGRLLLIDESLREELPLVFDFLGVPDPQLPPPPLDPDARQRQLYRQVRRILAIRGEQESTVTLLEDLHWFDGGSDSMLAEIVEGIAPTRALVIVNFRPEYHAAWMQKSYYEQIPLMPLSPEAIRELVRDRLGNDPSVESLPQLIHERSGGNPFFAEEILQSLIETDHLEGHKGAYRLVTPIGQISVPATVQSLLAARIDRLAEREKQVLQTASVIGKTFEEPLLREVVELPDTDLASALSVLTGSEFLYEASLYPEIEYAFKHPLTQAVAYESQLRERRERTHGAVLHAIERAAGERLDEQAALLAHHAEHAGLPEEAARWHARAAETAGANDPSEAMQHWESARTFAGQAGETDDLIRLGSRACAKILGFSWRLGMTQEEASRVFDEGRAGAEQVGDLDVLSELNGGYGALRGLAGSVPDYVRHTGEATELAERAGNPGLALAMGSYHAYALLFAGAFPELIEHAERVLAEMPEDVTLGKEFTGYSPYVAHLNSLGYAQTPAGHIDAGRETLERGLQLAREHGEHEVLVWIRSFVSQRLWTGEPGMALEEAREGLAAAERVGSPQVVQSALSGLGAAHLLRREFEEAVSTYEQCLRASEEERVNRIVAPSSQALLALALLGLGETDRARETAEEAISTAEEVGTRESECTAHIALARVLLASFPSNEANRIDSSLSRAFELTEQTGARLYVPWIHRERATLARRLGNEDERRRGLQIALGLFTEMGVTGPAERIADELRS